MLFDINKVFIVFVFLLTIDYYLQIHQKKKKKKKKIEKKNYSILFPPSYYERI